MILKPIDNNIDIFLLNDMTSSWLLRYLSKMQDRISHLCFCSDETIIDIENNGFENKHIYRAAHKAAIEVSVNSVSVDEPKSIVGMSRNPQAVAHIAFSKPHEVTPIIVVDSSTPQGLIDELVAYKNKMIVLIHSGDSLTVYAQTVDGPVEGYSTIPVLSEEIADDYAGHILSSTLLFTVINKLIAREALLANVYTLNTDEISIIKTNV